MVAVRNIKGTSKERYAYSKGYPSWLEYWKHKSRFSFPSYCQCVDCSNPAEVGAHVMKVYGNNAWYIIPLCQKCNMKTEPFFVNGNYLVEVNE